MQLGSESLIYFPIKNINHIFGYTYQVCCYSHLLDSNYLHVSSIIKPKRPNTSGSQADCQTWY